MIGSLATVLIHWLPDPALRIKRRLTLGEKWGTAVQTFPVDPTHPSYTLALALSRQDGDFFKINCGFDADITPLHGDTWVANNLRSVFDDKPYLWKETQTPAIHADARYAEELNVWRRTGKNAKGQAQQPLRTGLGSTDLSPTAEDLLEHATQEWLFRYTRDELAGQNLSPEAASMLAQDALATQLTVCSDIVTRQMRDFYENLETSIKNETPHALFDMEAFNRVALQVPETPKGNPFQAVPPPPPQQPPPPMPPPPQVAPQVAPPVLNAPPATSGSVAPPPATVTVGNVVRVDAATIAEYSSPAPVRPPPPPVYSPAPPALNPPPVAGPPTRSTKPPGFG